MIANPANLEEAPRSEAAIASFAGSPSLPSKLGVALPGEDRHPLTRVVALEPIDFGEVRGQARHLLLVKMECSPADDKSPLRAWQT